MSKRPWYPMYTSDFDRKTKHLSAECVGCYVRLLNHYWDNNGRLNFDPPSLCRIMGVERRRFNRVWKDLKTFFVRQSCGCGDKKLCTDNGGCGDTLLQGRLQEELEKTISISEAKAKSGKLGGQASAIAKQQAKINTLTHTLTKEHSVNKLTDAEAPEIDEKEAAKKRLWNLAKNDLGISGSVVGKSIKQFGEHAVACAIEETASKQPADPTPYFLKLLKTNPKTGKQPDWQRIPYDDTKLQAWATKHGFRDARAGEGYPEYRAYLVSAVTLKKDKTA